MKKNGDTLYTQKRYRQAKQQYQKCELDGCILYRIGNCIHNLGDYQQAVKYFERSLEFQQVDKKLVFFNLGNTLRKMKKYEQAVNIYKKALDIQGNYIDVLINLAKCYRKMRNLTGAYKCYQIILRQKPEMSISLYNKSFLEEEMGEYKKAIQSINKAILLDNKVLQYYKKKYKLLKKYYPHSTQIQKNLQIIKNWKY